jgi:hypothetical protein
MQHPISRSRKTLHLPHRRHADTSTQTTSAAVITPIHKGDRDGKSGRIIEIRYRCGNTIDPVVISTAVDMRKRFFSSTNIYGLN